jgi:hypothetical protein
MVKIEKKKEKKVLKVFFNSLFYNYLIMVGDLVKNHPNHPPKIPNRVFQP